MLDALPRVTVALALLAGCGAATRAGGDGSTAGTDAAPEASDASGEVADGSTGAWDTATLPDGKCVSGAYPPGGPCTCDVTLPDVCGNVCVGARNDAGQCVTGVYDTMHPTSEPVPLEPACVNLHDDDDHCGTCDTACAPNATCVAGVCGPSPTTAVAPPALCGPMRLAGSSTTLFWTDTRNGVVMSMPAAGGTPRALSGAETTAPTLLFVQGQAVLWLDGETIRRGVGGSVSDVVTAVETIRGINASDDGATVYVSSGSKVVSVPVAGGATTDVVLQDSGGLPAALAIQGNLLAFLIDVVGGIDITRVGGGAPVAHCWSQDPANPLSTDLDVNCDRIGYGFGLVSDVLLTTPTNLFWIDDTQIRTNELSAHAPPQRDVVVDSGTRIRSMALANGEIVFTSSDPNDPSHGQLQKVAVTARADAPAIPLARNLPDPTSVTIAGGRIFWVTSGCAIQTTSATP